jgi:hypothetical protein
LFNPIENRGEVILNSTPAIAVTPYGFTSKAAYASLEVEIIEMYKFRFCPL